MVGGEVLLPDPKGNRVSSPISGFLPQGPDMKLSDAAIWEIEMGRTPPAPGPPSGAYKRFDSVFRTLPWLHKARLQVVDRQASRGAPDWIVVQDIEDPSVYLLLGADGRQPGAGLVRPVDPSFTAPSGTHPGNWELRGQVAAPEDLLRAIRLRLGRGRHIG